MHQYDVNPFFYTTHLQSFCKNTTLTSAFQVNDLSCADGSYFFHCQKNLVQKKAIAKAPFSIGLAHHFRVPSLPALSYST